MRNFRTAAVASATAVTVVLGGTAIASAQPTTETSTKTTTAAATTTGNEQTTKAEPTATTTAKVANDKQVIFAGKVRESDKDLGAVISDGTKGLNEGKGSSQYTNDTKEPFYITDAFGKRTNAELVPQWARIWIDATVVAGIGAVVGLIIAGINFASYNGWITLPSL